MHRRAREWLENNSTEMKKRPAAAAGLTGEPVSKKPAAASVPVACLKRPAAADQETPSKEPAAAQNSGQPDAPDESSAESSDIPPPPAVPTFLSEQ
eukprot:9261858-Pyramimonas_sp.AAC.1